MAGSGHGTAAFAGPATLTSAIEDFSDVPPFDIRSGAEQRVPFVFDSPHSGRTYPERFLAMTRLDGDAIRVDLGPGINDDRQPAFSDAERHCLELMAEAQGPGRIAQAMGMEVEAVQAMENAIIAKFSANNRFQAVAKAALLGLVKS